MGNREVQAIRSGRKRVNINTLRDFLKEYQNDPGLTLLGSTPKPALPPVLSNCQEWGAGIQIPRSFYDVLTVSQALLRSPEMGGKQATRLELTHSKKVLDGKVLQFDDEESIDFGELHWQPLGGDGLQAKTRFKSEIVRKTYQWVGNENILLTEESLPGRTGEALLYWVPGADDRNHYLKMIRTYFDDGANRIESLAIPLSMEPPPR